MSLLMAPGCLWGFKLSRVDMGCVIRESAFGLYCSLLHKKLKHGYIFPESKLFKVLIAMTHFSQGVWIPWGFCRS